MIGASADACVGVVAIPDPPPHWMRLMGMAAFDRREPSVRVAHLELDTLLPQPPDDAAPRLLRFTTSDHVVTVAVTNGRRAATLAISLSPPGVVGVDVRPLHGLVRRVWSDARGIASCRSIPHGPVSLLVHWPSTDGGPIRTAWTQI